MNYITTKEVGKQYTVKKLKRLLRNFNKANKKEKEPYSKLKKAELLKLTKKKGLITVHEGKLKANRKYI